MSCKLVTYCTVKGAPKFMRKEYSMLPMMKSSVLRGSWHLKRIAHMTPKVDQGKKAAAAADAFCSSSCCRDLASHRVGDAFRGESYPLSQGVLLLQQCCTPSYLTPWAKLYPLPWTGQLATYTVCHVGITYNRLILNWSDIWCCWDCCGLVTWIQQATGLFMRCMATARFGLFIIYY